MNWYQKESLQDQVKNIRVEMTRMIQEFVKQFRDEITKHNVQTRLIGKLEQRLAKCQECISTQDCGTLCDPNAIYSEIYDAAMKMSGGTKIPQSPIYAKVNRA